VSEGHDHGHGNGHDHNHDGGDFVGGDMHPSKVHVYREKYDKPRVFVRGVESNTYSLTEQRRELLASVPRKFKPELGFGTSENWNIMQPGDEPYRSQSLHVHFVTVQPGGRNDGHGHPNEAFFYILEGHGYEMHDGKKYPWEKGDAVVVHNDCVHWHNNGSDTERAVALVMKAKPAYIFMGLWQQGKIGTTPKNPELYGPPIDFEIARAPKDVAKPKVIRPGDTPWEWTPHGYVRWLAGEHVSIRVHATDCYLQEIPGGSRSGKRWQMADQVVYIEEGEGYDLHWDVEPEITDKFYARVRKEPTRWEWKKGDVIWVPQNTIFQHFNSNPDKPAKLVVSSNRMFNWLGYSKKVDLENAPEWDAEHASNGVHVNGATAAARA